MSWDPERSKVTRVDAPPDAIPEPPRPVNRSRYRTSMQPLGNLNNVVRKQKRTKPVEAGYGTDSAAARLEDVGDEGDLPISGTEMHLFNLVEDDDVDVGEVLDAVDYVEHQASRWTDLDVWD